MTTRVRKYKNNINCCVYGCHSRGSKNLGISFHSFPKKGERKVRILNKFGTYDEIDKRKAWILKIKTGKMVTEHMKICSLHFKKDDYILPDVPCKKKTLKQNAVPTLNLPKVITRTERPRNLCRNTDKMKDGCSVNIITEPENHITESNNFIDAEVTIQDNCVPSLNEMEAALALLKLCEGNTRSIGTQVKCGDIFSSFITFINTEEKLNTLTGIPSFTVLDSIETAFKLHFPDKKLRKLTVRERLIMCFIKMKQNLSFTVIAILFRNVTARFCSIVFQDTIDKLYFLLDVCILWPSKEEIINNMPICFNDFQNVRIVLDCTEIPLQKPKCLCCRVKTYSHYKGKNTIKFLVGVTPGGLISFVSEAYGGRASDNSILEQSDLLKKLTPHEDAVMIDKGFKIDALAREFQIKVICPPFLRKKIQFSPEEAELNRKIACARVHIERVFQRIKMFKIVKEEISWNIVPKIEKIFTILCAITNLRSPVLSDDKYLE